MKTLGQIRLNIYVTLCISLCLVIGCQSRTELVSAEVNTDIVKKSPKIDYQKSADRVDWAWSDEMASPFYCIGQAGNKYDIHLISQHDNRSMLTIRIMDDKDVIHSWLGHKRSVFRILDDRLYYADFYSGSSGGSIVAFDLKSGKELWKSPLKALGPIEHSAYFNWLNLDANYDVVTIFGYEARGRYFESKDVHSGQTLGHKVFKDPPLKENQN